MDDLPLFQQPCGAHEPTTTPSRRQEPFTFAGTAAKNLIRGELLVFYVDSTGRVTCDKLDLLDSGTLRLASRPREV